MPKEIERKFLVKNDSFKQHAEGEFIHQGFLSTTKERVVRVRIRGDQAWLTIKGLASGATRIEFEYPIPVDDAGFILKNLCRQPTIEKQRYIIPQGRFTWEVDEFHGDNEGLVLAEIEIPSEDTVIDLPAWVGQEVTGDPKYYNSNLVEQPYKNW